MKRVLLLLVFITAGISVFAQTHTVTGKVINEQGQGLQGSEVSVKGEPIATVTDVNGDWLLEVPDGKYVFFAELPGYGSSTVEDSSQFILIQLKATSKELEGNVVAALDFTRDKRETGFTAQTLNHEDIVSGGNTSVISGLSGKLTGANITNYSGAGLGGSTRIVLRGEKSFFRDNNALTIVDGTEINNYERTLTSQGLSSLQSQLDFGNGANDINPDDIQSITVLEGAAAATLYGSAGANGAIMITTKRGNGGECCGKRKMEVSYKIDYSNTQVLSVPEGQHQYGQGDIYAPISDYRATNYSWGLPFDNNMRPWGQIIQGKQLVKNYSDQPDNIIKFFDKGKNLNNYLSVSGGTENTTYFLSLNAITSTGVVPNNFYSRYGVRFNAETKLSNNFYSSVNINYNNSYARANYEGNGGSTGNAGTMESLVNAPRDIPTWELSNLNNKFYSMDYLDTAGVHRYGNYASNNMNPYWAAKYFDNRNLSDRVTGNVKVGYRNGEFNVYDRIGADINSDRSFYQAPNYHDTAVNVSGLYPGRSYIGTSYNSNGGYTQATYNGLHLHNDLVGTFDHAIDKDFGMMVTAGTSISAFRDERMSSVIDPISNGLLIENFFNLNNSVGPVVTNNSRIDYRTWAVYSGVRFNYQRELYLDLTGRIDWTSTTSYDAPHFFPGANTSWIFTERLKGWLKDNLLNYGKIRFGAAGAGTDAMPYANNNAGYQQLPIASAYGVVTTPFNNLPVYQLQNVIGNPKLKQELTREYEVGTDLSMLRNRLNFSFTYYNSYTYNVIAPMPIAPSSGFLYNYINVGDVTNRGEELALRGTPIATKWGLTWDLFVSYTHNVNNVVSLANGLDHITLASADGLDIVAAQGHPLGTFYGADVAYMQDTKTGIWHPIVDATTGLPVPTAKAQYRGSYQPKFVASWGTDVCWNGLKLHVLFTTKQGGMFYSHDKLLMDIDGNSQETTINNRKPLVWANSVNQVGNTNSYVTNTTKYLPYNYFVNEIGSGKLPVMGLVDATYVKLQEVSVSYKIPHKYYQSTPFGGLEAGLYGNNLILWVPSSNHYGDPEVSTTGITGNAQGINYSANPSVMNYGFFVKVTF